MNADLTIAQAALDTAFKTALRTAAEGTGLESRFPGRSEPGTGECLPWLRRAGGDDSAVYRVDCGLRDKPDLPDRAWPTYLRITCDWLAGAGTQFAETRGELVFCVTLAGHGARNAGILAAITVAVVLGHDSERHRRTS
jgi:hypothetical protein